MIDRMYLDPMQRFFSKVNLVDSCWAWTDHLAYGYGVFSIRGTVWKAHRFSYLIFNGPLASNLELDHLCRNRACVNPDHLEQVTRRVNFERGIHPATTRIKKTHCSEGHALTGGNRIDRGGSARCRVCFKSYQRSWYLRKKERGI